MTCPGPWPAFRMLGGLLPAVPDWGDVAPFEATVSPHPYLHCVGCGARLWHGETTTGASVYVCRSCKRVADVRRVA